MWTKQEIDNNNISNSINNSIKNNDGNNNYNNITNNNTPITNNTPEASDNIGDFNSIQYSLRRCDQCAKGHRKCDRRLPQCLSCTSKLKTCTYLKYAYKNNDTFNLSSINNYTVKFAEDRKGHKRKGKKEELLLNNNDNDDKLVTKSFYIQNISSGMIKYYTMKQFFNRFPRKGIFESMSTLLQHPTPFKNNNKLLLFFQIADNYQTINKECRIDLRNSQKLIKGSYHENLQTILKEAYINYFKYYNTNYPLFIKREFNYNLRSRNLKLAILLGGLNRMKVNSTNNSIINFIQDKLNEDIRSPYRLAITLENVQAVFVLMQSSYSTPWLTYSFEIYYSYCVKGIDVLGLPFNFKKLSSQSRKERVLLYATLLYYYHFLGLFLRLNFSLPYQPYYLKQYFRRVQMDILKFQCLKKNKDIDFYYQILLASFYNEIGSILYSIRLLKENYINNIEIMRVDKSDGYSDNNSIKNVIKRIQKVKDHYFKLFLLLKLQTNNNIANNNLNYNYHYNQRILFICHFLIFFSKSLKFYNLNDDDFNSNFHNNSDNKRYLSETIIECVTYINHGIQLPAGTLSNIDVALLSHGIAFFVRYQPYSRWNLKWIINQSFEFLNQCAKLETYLSTASINNKINLLIKNTLFKKQK
ncbi:hypothetical protein K502DRAFT_351710 [Neoconidiobolus thromboides FSU 785]|nr:hypothetical protein K502DRAFT_351710 [Neoconidiobolus thromboides FSU 785]